MNKIERELMEYLKREGFVEYCFNKRPGVFTHAWEGLYNSELRLYIPREYIEDTDDHPRKQVEKDLAARRDLAAETPDIPIDFWEPWPHLADFPKYKEAFTKKLLAYFHS